MKKTLYLFLLLIFSFTLVSCIEKDDNTGELPVDQPTEKPIEPPVTPGIDHDGKLNIFYLNDTHGAVLNNGQEMGLANIANYVITKQDTLDNDTIFVTGGDMFQGQLISNDNKGAVMVEALNQMKLDAFIIGNHEFDWGLDVVLNYFNEENSNVKANFPLLGSNVVLKSTRQRPEGIDSHVIVEKNGLKVGIIGAIGDGQETSISTPRVRDYQFTDAYTAIEKTAREISSSVDIILVGIHASNQFLNNRIVNIPKVKTIFNAHTHMVEKGTLINSSNENIPYIQTGSNGYNLGHIALDYQYKNGVFNINKTIVENLNRSNEQLFSEPNKSVEAIVNKYYEPIESKYTEPIIKSGEYMDKNTLATFIARLMKEVTGSVAGFQNSGGTRDTIRSGQMITVADVFQVFPFDNSIIYTEVPGWYLKELLNDSYFKISSDINQRDIIDNDYYRVATNDYVFYSSYQKFESVQLNPEIRYGDMFEVFVEVLEALKDNGETVFYSSSPILIGIDKQKYFYFKKESLGFFYV